MLNQGRLGDEVQADDLLALARQLGLGRYGTYPSELEGEVLREEHSEK